MPLSTFLRLSADPVSARQEDGGVSKGRPIVASISPLLAVIVRIVIDAVVDAVVVISVVIQTRDAVVEARKERYNRSRDDTC